MEATIMIKSTFELLGILVSTFIVCVCGAILILTGTAIVLKFANWIGKYME